MNEIDLLKKHIRPERAEKIEAVLCARTRDVTVVLDRLNKPHNFMAILRTCDAFGIQDAHIVLQPGQPGDHISDPITQGAHKWLTINISYDWRERFQNLKNQGYKLYASGLSESAAPLESLDLKGRVALVFGNELEGLAKEQIAFCDGLFMLPMLGFAQSFNVSVAAALSLQKLFSLREARGIPKAPLDEVEREALRREWLIKALHNAELILREYHRRDGSETR